MPEHVATPDPLRRAALDPDSYGTTLLVALLDACVTVDDDDDSGVTAAVVLGWHPETIAAEAERHFGARLPATNFNKLMAAISVVTSDEFFRSGPRFIPLTNALASGSGPDQFDVADSAECAWAITEALLLHPPDENEEPFSDEVRGYVGGVLREEGFVTPPDVLRIAIDANFADKVRYGFADDPEMFSGINAVQRGKTTEIEGIVQDGLIELVAQLKTLPLSNGSVAELVERAARAARQSPGGA